MKSVSCKDVGVMDCDHVITGETEDEVMQKAAAHAKEVHGMSDADMTPEMVAKVRAAIKDA